MLSQEEANWLQAHFEHIDNKLDNLMKALFLTNGIDYDAERARIAAENA